MERSSTETVTVKRKSIPTHTCRGGSEKKSCWYDEKTVSFFKKNHMDSDDSENDEQVGLAKYKTLQGVGSTTNESAHSVKLKEKKITRSSTKPSNKTAEDINKLNMAPKSRHSRREKETSGRDAQNNTIQTGLNQTEKTEASKHRRTSSKEKNNRIKNRKKSPTTTGRGRSHKSEKHSKTKLSDPKSTPKVKLGK